MNKRHIDPLVAGLAIACLITAGIASCNDAKADTTVGLHLASHHFPSYDYQQNFNPGVYVRFDNGLTAGGYRNTIGRNSFYVGYTLEGKETPFALTVGAITGYQKRSTVTQVVTPIPCPDPASMIRCSEGHPETTWMGTSKGAVTLMFAPSIRLPEVLGVTPRVSVVPRLGAGSSTVVHLSIERGF